jgi:hypothetical protein
MFCFKYNVIYCCYFFKNVIINSFVKSKPSGMKECVCVVRLESSVFFFLFVIFPNKCPYLLLLVTTSCVSFYLFFFPLFKSCLCGSCFLLYFLVLLLLLLLFYSSSSSALFIFFRAYNYNIVEMKLE